MRHLHVYYHFWSDKPHIPTEISLLFKASLLYVSFDLLFQVVEFGVWQSDSWESVNVRNQVVKLGFSHDMVGKQICYLCVLLLIKILSIFISLKVYRVIFEKYVEKSLPYAHDSLNKPILTESFDFFFYNGEIPTINLELTVNTSQLDQISDFSFVLFQMSHTILDLFISLVIFEC